MLIKQASSSLQTEFKEKKKNLPLIYRNIFKPRTLTRTRERKKKLEEL